MGITASTSGPSQQKTLLQRLGDKFPFSDDELRKLIVCFQHTSSKTNVAGNEGLETTSFLSDLVAAASMHSTSPSEDHVVNIEQSRMAHKVKAAEKILPLQFGDHLRLVCFKNKNNLSYDSFSVDNSQNVKLNEDERELEIFLAGVADCSRRGSRMALKVIHACACSLNERSITDPKSLIDLCYRLAIASEIIASSSTEEQINEIGSLSDFPDALTKSLIEHKKKINERNINGIYQQQGSQIKQPEVVSLTEFTSWAETVAPLISSVLSTFIHRVLFPSTPFPPSRTPFIFPNLSLSEQPSAFVSSASNPLLFTFGCLAKSLSGKWFRLYTSDFDGLSFNRLQHSLQGYGGPTLMMIRATSGGTFGAFTGSAWKESGTFYGNDDIFLYQAEPCVGVYRPRSTSGTSNFMYCNSSARSKGYDGLAHGKSWGLLNMRNLILNRFLFYKGIGFGGTADQPRLFIPESFENCVASSRDLTFEQGLLLPPDENGSLQKYFEIESLEVWGVGGDDIVNDALNDRLKQRVLLQSNIDKARKVDKAQFLDDFKSGLIESKAFVHRDQMRGRDGDCQLDTELEE